MSKKNTVHLIANGDLRVTANQKCEREQLAMESKLRRALAKEGWKVVRAHGFRKEVGHSFIDSQKHGMEVFRKIPADAPLIVAEAVWQYSHHILHGLSTHRGPILTVANWSGIWPGLVGMLNLNGSLTKAGVRYSSLWSEDFTDAKFLRGLAQWLETGAVRHAEDHVRPFAAAKVPAGARSVARRIAADLRTRKSIMGVFDEGCMGMFNAIIPDELLFPVGVYKERLSQSALYAGATQVSDAEAQAVYAWLRKKGMTFHLGTDEATELTEHQVLWQCKTYVAALRIADEFGCETIGIQYQQGLKDLLPASDLVEGILNNSDRPPVKNAAGKVIRAGQPLTHFNEVDECAGLDGLFTHGLWKELGYEPENTLHDLRWGRHYRGKSGKRELDAYVWVFLISGAAPPAHFIKGFRGTVSERQPAMYFRLGGGTVKGVSKPGWIVWSRVYVEGGRLRMDTGLGEVVELPKAETEERWRLSTPQWPIMHVVLPGIDRDQMMARHKSNHIQVAYAPGRAAAVKALAAKAGAMRALGIDVAVCGDLR